MSIIQFEDLGTIPYKESWDKQLVLFDALVNSKRLGEPSHLPYMWMHCEHLPVITMGKHANTSNLLVDRESLKQSGVSIYEVERGGDITCHAPGQLVGYPILDIEYLGLGLKQYISLLEDIIIATVAHYGVVATRIPEGIGVWVDAHTSTPRKIAAIGVRSSRYITMHGYALNANTDLSLFSFINPCGFTKWGVTSIAQETGVQVDMTELKQVIEREVLRRIEI